MLHSDTPLSACSGPGLLSGKPRVHCRQMSAWRTLKMVVKAQRRCGTCVMLDADTILILPDVFRPSVDL